MIINVGLSPNSVVDLGSLKQGSTAPALQATLAEWLQSHGAVLMSSKAEAQALIQTVKNGVDLTESERHRWRELLYWLQRGGRLTVAQPELTPLEDSRDLNDAPGSLHRPYLAVVSNETFGHLHPDSDEGIVTYPGDLDIATSGAATLSPLFERAKLTANVDVYKPGRSREEVWNEVLRPLAIRTKQVTIFDPYVFSEMYRRDDVSDSSSEHLEWLLAKLNSTAPQGTMVKIFGWRKGTRSAVRPSGASPSQIAQLLRQRWSEAPNRVTGVELITLPAGQRFPHDRHIMFGDTTGLELPSGLDRLAQPTLVQPFSFGYKSKNPQLEALRYRVTTVQGLSAVVTPLNL
ncbi:hypothetical protein [Microbacterium sp.]|uniref:hypothetical protein n=1 Tax=Microbacterium sp. TaxID=51671 RepID=UPI003A8DCA85